MKQGDVFVADIPAISQEKVNAFGAILGTNGPIHTDPEFAKKTFLKGPVVQGMLVLAPVHDFMAQLFGAETWLRGGSVEVKVVSYTRPGDATRFELKIDDIDENAAKVSFSFIKDASTTVLVGTATVSFHDDATARSAPESSSSSTAGSKRDENLRKMFEPRSLAILGASEKGSKPGARILNYLRKYEFAGRVYPVNPKYPVLGGHRCYPDLASLPEAPDLAVISVPAKDVPAAVRDCVATGIGAVVIFTSGFAEMGAEGAALERQIREIAQATGTVICGPNCQGVGNIFTGMIANFSSCFSDDRVSPGNVGIVSESGLFGGLMAEECLGRDIGLGYLVSTGNESGMQFADAVAFMAGDPRIRVIAGYVEGIRDVERFRRAAERALQNDKVLVILKVGENPEAARVAAAHTGSVTGSAPLYQAALTEMGVITVSSLEELIDTVVTFSQVTKVPRGPRVGILTNSGGLGVFCADEVYRQGLQLARFDEETVSRIKGRLPEFGAAQNPVDITLQGYTDVDSVASHIENICKDPNVDIVTVCFGIQKLNVAELIRHIARIKDTYDVPVLVAWIAPDPAPKRALGKAGIATFSDPARALRAARRLFERQQSRAQAARSAPGERASGAVAALRDSIERSAAPARQPSPGPTSRGFEARPRARPEASHTH